MPPLVTPADVIVLLRGLYVPSGPYVARQSLLSHWKLSRLVSLIGLSVHHGGAPTVQCQSEGPRPNYKGPEAFH